MEKIKEKKLSVTADIETKELLLDMQNIYADISRQAEFSSKMIDKKILTSLTAEVRDFIKSPVVSGLKSIKILEDELRETVHNKIMVQFFKSNKDKIIAVHRLESQDVKDDNLLFYSIFLHDDSFAGEFFIDSFFFEYDHTNVAKRFPLFMDIIPNNETDKFAKLELSCGNYMNVEL